jgi:hypothetical protein
MEGMNMVKTKGYSWIYWSLLGILFIATLIWIGYEHLVNPSEPLGMVLLNLVLISIPLVLFYGCVGMILETIQQKEDRGKLTHRLSGFLYYTPRIAGLLMAFFIGLFALDVFGGISSIWQQILAFLIHASPAIVIAIIMIFAWRRPMIGFLLFGVAAISFLSFVFMGGEFAAGNFIMFVAPLALISALFWINWKWKDLFSLK